MAFIEHWAALFHLKVAPRRPDMYLVSVWRQCRSMESLNAWPTRLHSQYLSPRRFNWPILFDSICEVKAETYNDCEGCIATRCCRVLPFGDSVWEVKKALKALGVKDERLDLLFWLHPICRPWLPLLNQQCFNWKHCLVNDSICEFRADMQRMCNRQRCRLCHLISITSRYFTFLEQSHLWIPSWYAANVQQAKM